MMTTMTMDSENDRKNRQRVTCTQHVARDRSTADRVDSEIQTRRYTCSTRNQTRRSDFVPCSRLHCSPRSPREASETICRRSASHSCSLVHVQPAKHYLFIYYYYYLSYFLFIMYCVLCIIYYLKKYLLCIYNCTDYCNVYTQTYKMTLFKAT